MTQYEYYHVPGVDHLTRTEPDVLTLDQVASIAAQAGQKQILTESFALTGWNFNFRGMKWLYQIQMSHGVNFLCQHLESYSLKGTRKRDYPGSWFTHQPWWEDYKYINDRFTRIGRYLADGAIPSDVLVMHGQSSAWTLYNGGSETSYNNINAYCSSLKAICNELGARHVRMHLGDEIIMQRDAEIVDGKIVIGNCSYKTVVLPQINNMLRSTYELFKDFAAAGGRISA
jgi:hypothetical protein